MRHKIQPFFFQTQNIFRFYKIVTKQPKCAVVARLPQPLVWCTEPLLSYWVQLTLACAFKLQICVPKVTV